MPQLTIDIDRATGRLTVQTNPPQMVQDKVTCYGLLEAARDAIHEASDEAQRRAVQPVPSLAAAGLSPVPPNGSG